MRKKSLLAVKPPKNPRDRHLQVDQLLRAMDSRPEIDDPDSVNDGRGASEYLCCSDSAGADEDMNLAEMGAECEPSSAGDAGAGVDAQMPAKPPPLDGADADGYDPRKDRSGSEGRTRQSADAGPGRSDGARFCKQFMSSMTKRFKEIPDLIDSRSEDEARLTRPLSATGGRRAAPRAAADARAAAGAAAAAGSGAAGGGATASRRRNAQQSSVTASRRSAAAGADAGEVGVAQASGTGGEPTFTPTVPEPSDRCTRRLAAAANLSVSQHRLMSGLAADSTSSFSAAASSALHASRRRACAEAAQRGWKVLSSRLMKSHRAPATPDPPAVATGTLSSNNDSSRDRDEDQDGQGGKKQESEGGWNLQVKLR